MLHFLLMFFLAYSNICSIFVKTFAIMEKIEKNKLLLKMAIAKVKLPKYALDLFFEKYPEYINEKEHIYSVFNLRKADRSIIEKFESLI